MQVFDLLRQRVVVVIFVFVVVVNFMFIVVVVFVIFAFIICITLTQATNCCWQFHISNLYSNYRTQIA